MIAGSAAVLVWLVRRFPRNRVVDGLRFGLATLIAGAISMLLIATAHERPLTIWDVIPLQLCDFLLLLAVFALLTRQRWACELLYFWAGSGTLLAVLSPDLASGFPTPAFFAFFGLHGLVIAAAAFLTLGLGRYPRSGAIRRAFLLTNLYASIAAVANLGLGTNYLYLRAKPVTPTLLDWMGPWPIYILSGEALTLVLFAGLAMPFRSKR